MTGFLESCDEDGVLSGWAMPRDATDAPVLELLVDGRRVSAFRADEPRADLEAAYPGRGCASFRIVLPESSRDGTTHAIDVRHAATGASVLARPLNVRIAPAGVRELRARYIELMKKTLANVIYGDGSTHPDDRRDDFGASKRLDGQDWPSRAHTMVGLARLDNVRECVERVLADGVPGDLIETGVWRGGTTIFMRAILAAYGVTDRIVYVADSFRGLPPPDPAAYPADEGDALFQFADLAIPLETVRANFAAYDLLDDRVRFIEGWFRDTLPSAPIERLAVLRLDGDMYESTMVALDALYPKLSPGGFAIVDDYGAIPACKAAIEDFRAAHGIDDPVVTIDWTGVYWRKS